MNRLNEHWFPIRLVRLAACCLAVGVVAAPSVGERSLFAQAGDAAARRYEALRQFRAGRLDAALESYSEAIKREPASALGWTGRAVVRIWKDGERLEDLDDEREYDAIVGAVENDYLRALRLAEDPVADYQRWAGSGGRREAAALMKFVEMRASTNSTLALVAADKDDALVISRLSRAVELLPDYPFFRYERGHFLLAQGRLDEAVRDLDEVERIARLPRIGYRAGDPEGLAPDDAERQGIYRMALEMRGCAYRAKNDFAKALADLSEAIRLEPTTSAYFERGTTYLMQNDAERAAADCAEAVRLDPKNHRAHGNLALACLLRKEYDRALEAADAAIRLAPDQAGYYGARGAILVERRLPDEATADLNEALRLAPQLVDAYYYRGRAHLMKEDWGRAVADFGAVIRSSPSNAAAYRLRGVAYARQGDVAAARADWAKLRQLDPSVPSILRTIPATEDVDPQTPQIVVVFDRPMQTDGWSTAPVGEVAVPPMRGERPARFRDDVTWEFDVALRPNTEYALGFNTTDFPDFRASEGLVPAMPFVLKFKTGAAPTAPVPSDEGPQVVKTQPADGASDIEAGTYDLVIVFDEPMMRTESRVDVPAGAASLRVVGKARWIDDRTWRLPLLLSPGMSYQIGVNTGAERPFVGAADGKPARRFELKFRTEDVTAPQK